MEDEALISLEEVQTALYQHTNFNKKVITRLILRLLTQLVEEERGGTEEGEKGTPRGEENHLKPTSDGTPSEYQFLIDAASTQTGKGRREDQQQSEDPFEYFNSVYAAAIADVKIDTKTQDATPTLAASHETATSLQDLVLNVHKPALTPACDKLILVMSLIAKLYASALVARAIRIKNARREGGGQVKGEEGVGESKRIDRHLDRRDIVAALRQADATTPADPMPI